MGWIATLSSGETVYETEPVPGERTPWQKLLQFCREKKVRITGLSLFRNGVRVEALPHKMCDGYFHAYEAMKMVFREEVRMRQGIGSVVGDVVYITWMGLEPESNGVMYLRQDERSLADSIIHTTLQE